MAISNQCKILNAEFIKRQGWEGYLYLPKPVVSVVGEMCLALAIRGCVKGTVIVGPTCYIEVSQKIPGGGK